MTGDQTLFALPSWDAIRPHVTAVLAAVSQATPIYPPTFLGHSSIPILEERLASFHATVNQSLTQWHRQDAHHQLGELVPFQCQGPPRDNRFQDEVSMSQGHGASRSPSTPFQNNRQNLPAPRDSRTLPPINDSYSSRSAQSMGQNPAVLPTLPSSALQTPVGSETRPSRPIGVQNLLNPTARDTTESQSESRRRSAEHFDMPSALFGTTPRTLPTSFTPSSGSIALPSLTPPPMNSYPNPIDQASRRRSPSAYSSTTNSFHFPRGTIDAKKAPFGASRELTNILGPDIQGIPEVSLDPPLAGGLHGCNGPFALSPPNRRRSIGSMSLPPSAERRTSVGAPSQVHTSQSDSPTTSYSSYSHVSRTPPVSLPNASTNQPSSSGYFPQSYNSATTIIQAGFDSKESYSPVASSMGQNTYQMTLDTDQGPIQVPVDVQAASKVADEKRKRNATASHRFRQRRKEKERETSQNIAKLEHQLREVAEDREFYRMERDYFRSLAKNNPGQAQVASRPPSPRLLRQAQLGGSAVYVNSQWPAPEEGNRNGRNTRRRTSSYVPAQGLAPPTNNLPPHLPRHPQVNSNASENSGPGPRNRLPGPLSLKTGLFDPTPPPLYDSGRKPGS